MPQICALTLDGMVLMPKAFLIKRICRLGPDRMAQVCRALKVAVGC
jgi:mRNA-degrading endonuclease toxin of MazEF toxin-antitoxin module